MFEESYVSGNMYSLSSLLSYSGRPARNARDDFAAIASIDRFIGPATHSSQSGPHPRPAPPPAAACGPESPSRTAVGLRGYRDLILTPLLSLGYTRMSAIQYTSESRFYMIDIVVYQNFLHVISCSFAVEL